MQNETNNPPSGNLDQNLRVQAIRIPNDAGAVITDSHGRECRVSLGALLTAIVNDHAASVEDMDGFPFTVRNILREAQAKPDEAAKEDAEVEEPEDAGKTTYRINWVPGRVEITEPKEYRVVFTDRESLPVVSSTPESGGEE